MYEKPSFFLLVCANEFKHSHRSRNAELNVAQTQLSINKNVWKNTMLLF